MTVLFERSSPHGLVIGARAAEALSDEDITPEERALAAGLVGPRRAMFMTGRSTLREALARKGLPRGPVLRDERGAPTLPAHTGVSASISHKDDVAVALVASGADGSRHGVDVEIDRPMRLDIARRVLTDDELARAEGLSEVERGALVLRRFSMKEAIYKAIDPFVRRYVGFREVCLVESGDGFEVDLRLGPAADLVVEVALSEIALPSLRLVVSTARARRR